MLKHSNLTSKYKTRLKNFTRTTDSAYLGLGRGETFPFWEMFQFSLGSCLATKMKVAWKCFKGDGKQRCSVQHFPLIFCLKNLFNYLYISTTIVLKIGQILQTF